MLEMLALSNPSLFQKCADVVGLLSISILAELLEGDNGHRLPVGDRRHHVRYFKTCQLYLSSFLNLLNDLLLFHAILLGLSFPTCSLTPEKQAIHPIITDPALFIWAKEAPLSTTRDVGLVT